MQQHPRVAERVRFDVFEAEKLRDAGVVRAAKRVVGVGVDGRAVDLGEPVPGEEVGVERQREQPRQSQLARRADERAEQPVADPMATMFGMDRERADLAEVGPQDVERAASDEHATLLGDLEVLDVLVERHEFLGEQLATGSGVPVHERLDRRDVRGSRAADGQRHAQTLPSDYGWLSSAIRATRVYPAKVSQAAERAVALVTLGCARNEVDSEELAARLGAGGWTVSADPDSAEVVIVNTCGFIDAAKKDSIDTVLAAADTGKRVVAVGCLAERYGEELASSLPEAEAVLGFDSYADIAARLDDVAAGRAVRPHVPRDRRDLLPLAPAHRPAAAAEVAVPGHAWLPVGRVRLDDAPVAYLKLASGCDRRCSFCAIPSFRGSFVPRPPCEVLDEARWLAATGARELVLVSENSTSYGKDLADLHALELLLPRLSAIDGVDRVRVSYLQPAELRPSLLEVIASTPGVAPYFDLSFQHASAIRSSSRNGSSESARWPTSWSRSAQRTGSASGWTSWSSRLARPSGVRRTRVLMSTGS